MPRGVVTSLDRPNGLVNAVLDTGEEIEAPFLAGATPWPLCCAWFDGGPSYLCMGAIGDTRVVVRDDFMTPTTADSVTTATVTSDISWGFSASGTGSTDAYGSPGAGCAGARRLLAPTGSTARIRAQNQAITIPTEGSAVWMQAHARINGDLIASENAAFRIGLGNADISDAVVPAAATDVGAYVLYTGTGDFRYRTHDGTTDTQTTSDYTPTADEWFWIDIVLVAGEWAAFWINGSGPFVNDTDIPDDTDEGVTPFARVSVLEGNTAHLILDLIEVQLVTPVLHATDYELETHPAET